MSKKRMSWLRPALLVLIAGLIIAGVAIGVLRQKPPPITSAPIQARLELAAGVVTVDAGEGAKAAVSGSAVRAGSSIQTSEGARALLRLPDGSSAFIRGNSQLQLAADNVMLAKGEYWLDVPPLERGALVHKLGEVTVTATDAGMSLRVSDDIVQVYVARGMAVVSSSAGRAEVNAGEQAQIKGAAAPAVEPLAFWDDWTGGMADFEGGRRSPGAGAGTVYGVDVGAVAGRAAARLQVKRQSVRAVLRDGLSETEVDQTFFNPSPRPVEGWYWFEIPNGASVTSFAVETDGNLVQGEFIEKKEAVAQYGRAKATGHAPAILEWVNGNTYRARIFPITASGERRIVLRYLELSPVVDGKLSYLYPLGQGTSTRIGEFSLSVELGEAGRKMQIATLDDARIEDGGRRVTMRRSGYTPRVDFQLEAQLNSERASLRVSRYATGGESADYIMARYTPQVDWAAIEPPRADVVVVVDTSADGDDAARQLKAGTAEAILRALAGADRFALVSLDVKPTVVHPAKGLAEASDKEIAAALESLADHASGGATDLSALFDTSLSRLHNTEQPAIVYVGDGLATSGEMNGEQLIERLRRALGTSRARLFTVGVGEDADRALLTELARAGGGESFAVDVSGEATAKALQLVAAVKVPTITDFEIDLGAGLDEPFSNVTGKVPRGSDVLLLARTHHDLPKEANIRGRIGGKEFKETIKVTQDKTVLTGFVPRLWAAAYVQRLLGAAAGPDAERGRVAALGIEYGLVTPFTSVLALESERAYRRMGIPRRNSKLRGVRLGSLTPSTERNVIAELHPLPPTLAFGCDAMSGADEQVASEDNDLKRTNKPQRNEPQSAATSMPAAEPATAPIIAQAEAEADDVTATTSPNPSEPTKMEGIRQRPKRNNKDIDSARVHAAAPRRLEEKSRPAPTMRGLAQRPEKEGGRAQGKGSLGKPFGGGQTKKDAAPRKNRRPQQWRRRKPVLSTCSDVARRPLAQRVLLWRKRLRTAKNPQALIQRYETARRACELTDWRQEQAFLRLMQRHANNEGSIAVILRHFASRPQVQRFVARLIVRRLVDDELVIAVKRMLFGSAVNWNDVDRRLSEIENGEERLSKLRDYVAREPDDPQGQIRLVELLAASNQTEKALTMGRRLRDRGLLTPRIARQLGDVLARANLDDEAVRTYSEIVEFDPSNRDSRMLLGDIYLGHGWYSPAYSQYKTVANDADADPLAWLRLASAAAGNGRIDEALRIERRVATAQGRPGPNDPRRWARLWSAARVSRILANPPAKNAPSKRSLERKLKELQLFGGSAGTLTIITWEEMRSNFVLTTEVEDVPMALGDISDAAVTGLSSVLWSKQDEERAKLIARLRSVPVRDEVTLHRHDIRWDGKQFNVNVSQHTLAPKAARIEL